MYKHFFKVKDFHPPPMAPFFRFGSMTYCITRLLMKKVIPSMQHSKRVRVLFG